MTKEHSLSRTVKGPVFIEKNNKNNPVLGRRILLLQGLMGPLFRELGKALVARGHEVWKVNFNGGDRAFWRLPGGIDYRGDLASWPSVLTQIMRQHKIQDVILFGDCRPHHLSAKQVCADLGATLHVFEEGYIRPDWVTFERGGVNGHSSLPRDPQWYLAEAAQLPPVPPHAQVASSFRRRALEGLLYNCADVFTRWRYPHWDNHRPWDPWIEGLGWIRKLRNTNARMQASKALIMRIASSPTGYFLHPLQLDSDAQIRLHSPFAGVADALRLVLESFALHAPQNTRLIVKEHPLDNGVRDWRQLTQDMAELFGVAGRVDYMGWGDIVPVTERALGMVTVNSTSGTLALAMGIPVLVLGTAVYDIPLLTHQEGITSFWQKPALPDPEVFAAFRRVLIERCLIPGGFFSTDALNKVVRHAVARLEGRAIPAE